MQSYHRVHVQLRRKDRQKIASMLSKGQESVRVLRRASILRLLDGGQKAVQVAANTGVAPKTVRAVARRYEEEDWGRRCTKRRGPASSQRWTPVRVSGSSPWCVVQLHWVQRGGACA